jgi:hypothetical protein
MTRIAELGVELAEALAADDGLAVAQILADARAYGGRPAVLGVLDAACVWLYRTGPHNHPTPAPIVALRPSEPLAFTPRETE